MERVKQSPSDKSTTESNEGYKFFSYTQHGQSQVSACESNLCKQEPEERAQSPKRSAMFGNFDNQYFNDSNGISFEVVPKASPSSSCSKSPPPYPLPELQYQNDNVYYSACPQPMLFDNNQIVSFISLIILSHGNWQVV